MSAAALCIGERDAQEYDWEQGKDQAKTRKRWRDRTECGNYTALSQLGDDDVVLPCTAVCPRLSARTQLPLLCPLRPVIRSHPYSAHLRKMRVLMLAALVAVAPVAMASSVFFQNTGCDTTYCYNRCLAFAADDLGAPEAWLGGLSGEFDFYRVSA